MKIINKIKFLQINEYWFVQKEEDIRGCLCSFNVYRDSRVDIRKRFCFQEKKWTLVTDLSIDKEEIFKQFSSNLRNEIRKVQKLENVIISYNEIDKNTFINFYNDFAKEKQLDLLDERRLNKYGNNLFFVSAKLDNELTNVQVYIVDEVLKISRLLYSVSTIHGLEDKIKRNQIGWINKALHWYAIEYMQKNGFEIFDWGGYSNDKNNKALAGIDKFKKSFGGELVEIYDYKSFPFYLLEQLRNQVK